MNTKASIRQAYDEVAKEYTTSYWNELDRKPFDRMILDWFAAQIPSGERVLEIGCGPGEVAGYLARAGVDCLATDLSPQMIAHGKEVFPKVQFEVQDFFNLTYKNDSFVSAVGFYAIVNLVLNEVRAVIKEIKRVLKPGGIFLFSFHIFEGEEKLEVGEFMEHKIDPLAFYFFKADDVKALAENAGFEVADILIRYPYPNAEYPSKRAYFVVKKP